MNFPQTVEELLHWDVSTDRDTFGTYHIITGFEGTGGCFWCGKELEGHRRFCGHQSGCWTHYQDHFYWNYARFECLKRAGHQCENCGAEEKMEGEVGSWYYVKVNLEAHHIIPLEGEERSYSPYNVPWNLICLCHICHQLIHAVMRELNRPAPLDIFSEAEAKGQGSFELLKLM